MPYVTGYQKVRIFVPGRPDFPEGPVDPGWGVDEGGYPDQGLPGGGGRPERPGQGLPRPPRPVDPGWGVDEGAEVGWPLPPLEPRPPRPVYPIVEDHELGGHPDLPDLNMTRRITVTDGLDTYTAYALEHEPPQVEEDYEPRYPTKGLPGTWVAVLYGSALTWAWVRTPGAPEPEEPERAPKFG